MQPLKVLIVDDDADFAESLGDLVRFYGHEVDLVHSGEGALGAIGQKHYDMVFLDIRMPDHSGLDLYPRLKEMSPSSCIVFATAYIADMDRNASQQVRWAELLEKPRGINKVEELLARVNGDRAVLLVGEHGNMDHLKMALNYRGHRILEASTVAKAVDLLLNEEQIIVSAVLGGYAQSDGDMLSLVTLLKESGMSFPVVLLDNSGFDIASIKSAGPHIYTPINCTDEQEILDLVERCEALFNN